jgi:hypothetical protein
MAAHPAVASSRANHFSGATGHLLSDAGLGAPSRLGRITELRYAPGDEPSWPILTDLRALASQP